MDRKSHNTAQRLRHASPRRSSLRLQLARAECRVADLEYEIRIALARLYGGQPAVAGRILDQALDDGPAPRRHLRLVPCGVTP